MGPRGAALRLGISAAILAVPAVVAGQQAAPDSIRATHVGVYTAGQAERGLGIYLLNCVSCHTPASHTGPGFAAKWDGQLLWELYRFVSESMPKTEPGSLAPEEYILLVAYLLRMNGVPAGQTELPADSTALKKIRIELAPKRDSTQPR